MITFKEFIVEESDGFPMYRMVGDTVAAAIQAGKALPITRKFTSFVRDKKHLKSEFGNRIIQCFSQEFPKGVKIEEVQYDLEWFTRDKLHHEILLSVTGKTEKQWLDDFNGDWEAAEEEIEALFGDEHEVIAIGLKSFDPRIFKVIK